MEAQRAKGKGKCHLPDCYDDEFQRLRHRTMVIMERDVEAKRPSIAKIASICLFVLHLQGHHRLR